MVCLFNCLFLFLTIDTVDESVLNQAPMAVIDMDTCRQVYEGIFNFDLTDQMLCAGSEEGGRDHYHVCKQPLGI